MFRPTGICFNPRPRVGGDTTSPILLPPPVRFQSTPPRGGRLLWVGYIQRPDGVSIHAPAWGATLPPTASSRPSEVSIHAPAWGATEP